MMRRRSSLALGLGVLALLVVARPSGAALVETGASAPRLVVTPASLSFTRVGEARTLTFSNRGGGTLHLGGVSVVTAGQRGSTDFVLDAPGPRELPAGASSTLTVTFRPISERAPPQVFAALLIPADDPALPTDIDLRARAATSRHVAGVALRAGATSLLSALILLPLLGFVFMLLAPRSREDVARAAALATSGGALALVGWLVARFDPTVSNADGNFGLQFVEHRWRLGALHLEYFVGVDGLSLTLVVLTALLGFVAVAMSGAAGARPHDRRARSLKAMLLLLQAAATGVFCALDGVLYVGFWSLAVVAAFILIGSGVSAPGRHAAAPVRAAARAFLVSAGTGTVIILLALLALHSQSGPTYLSDGTPTLHTFDLMKLAYSNDFARVTQPALFGLSFGHAVWLALFVGFALTIPVFPFHRWLSQAHQAAPHLALVLVSGVFVKMGLYGLLRVSWGILPQATQWASAGVAVIGVLTILRGGAGALAAAELRGVLGFCTLAHLGFCLLGLATLTPLGLSGALFQMFGQGLVVTLLAVSLGGIHQGGQSGRLSELAGFARARPRAAACLVFALAAALGSPGLPLFLGQTLIVLASFAPHPLLTLLVLGGAAVLVGAAVRAMLRLRGPVGETWRVGPEAGDLRGAELVVVLAVGVLTLGLGLWPAPILNTVASSVSDLVRLMSVSGR